MTLTPDTHHIHGDLAHVAQTAVGGLFAEADGQRDFAPAGVVERRRVAAEVQADDEVDSDLDQVLQQLQIAKLAVEHQRLVAQERLELVKGFPMVLVARARQLHNRLGGIGDKATGQRPAAIGRRQEQ